jgi:hypothetical protein
MAHWWKRNEYGNDRSGRNAVGHDQLYGVCRSHVHEKLSRGSQVHRDLYLNGHEARGRS